MSIEQEDLGADPALVNGAPAGLRPPGFGRGEGASAPTPGMIDAGRQAFSDWDEAYGVTLSEFIWRAMFAVSPLRLSSPENRLAGQAIAYEAGYLACERGDNFQKAMADFRAARALSPEVKP